MRLSRTAKRRTLNQLAINAIWVKDKIVVDVNQIGKTMDKQKRKKSIDQSSRHRGTSIMYQQRSARKGLRPLGIIDAKRRILVKMKKRSQKMGRRSDEIELKQEKRRNKTSKQNQSLISHSQSPRATSSQVRSKRNWLQPRRKSLSNRKSVRLHQINILLSSASASTIQDTRNIRLPNGDSRKVIYTSRWIP